MDHQSFSQKFHLKRGFKMSLKRNPSAENQERRIGFLQDSIKLPINIRKYLLTETKAGNRIPLTQPQILPTPVNITLLKKTKYTRIILANIQLPFFPKQ